MLTRGKHELEMKCACVFMKHPGKQRIVIWRTSHTAEIVTFPFSIKPEISSGLELVEWAVHTCMLQQFSLLKWLYEISVTKERFYRRA